MADTFPRLLLDHAATRPHAPALREKAFGLWQTLTWAQLAELVQHLALGFAAAGLKRGEHVVIVGENRPRLYASMLAAQALGAVPVPLYQDAVAAEFVFPLNNAEVAFAVVEDQEQVDKLLELRAQCPQLQRLWFDDPRGLRHYDEPGLASLDELVEQGRAQAAAQPHRFADEVAAGQPGDVAALFFTSGTTGHPKGVVHTHATLLDRVIYGGWGRSYDRKMANNALDELQKNAQAGGEIWMIRNDFKMPFADQMSIGVRQAVGDWNVDVALSNVHAKHQFIWFGGNRDPNGGWGTQNPIDPLWGGPNGYGTLVLGDFVGENKANSLFVSLEKPYTPASGWSMTVAYTHTNAKTNANSWTDDIFDWTYGKSTHGFNPNKDAERDRLVVGGFTDRMPWGLQLSGKLTLGSGQPRQVTDCHLGFPSNTSPGTCVYVKRDSDSFKQLDMALAKNFKVYGGELQLRIDVLNLFNTANWGYYDDWVGGPSTPPKNALGGDNDHFDTKTGVRGPMRQFKLGASYTF